MRYGAHWGATGDAGPALASTFVSQAALESGIAQRLGRRRRFTAVRETRDVVRASPAWNRAVVPVRVDPTDGTVELHGRTLAVEPVSEVPLSRRYLLA